MEWENKWIVTHRIKVCLTKTNIISIYLPALYAEAQNIIKSIWLFKEECRMF